MTEVEIKEESLIVHVQGFHKILALRSQIEVPLSQIVNSWVGIDEETEEQFKHLWRLPGSYMPGLVIAGRYVNKEESQFWDVHKKKNAIVIELAHMEPHKIVIEVADPQATVDAIKQAIAKTKPA